MKNRRYGTLASLGCLLMMIALLGGCNRSSSTSPTEFFLALDATGSNKDKKDDYARAAHAVLSELPYTNFAVTMAAFGSQDTPSKIFTGKVGDPDELASSFQDYWKGVTPKGKGTYWAPVLRQVARVTKPTSVMIFTDGEIHDDDETCKSLIAEIASNSNVVAIFIGPVLVQSQYGDKWRSKIESVFSPLGNRAFVAGSNDREQQLRAFTEAIQK